MCDGGGEVEMLFEKGGRTWAGFPRDLPEKVGLKQGFRTGQNLDCWRREPSTKCYFLIQV